MIAIVWLLLDEANDTAFILVCDAEYYAE